MTVWDPEPNAGKWLRETINTAWPRVQEIGMHPDASIERLRTVDSVEELSRSADFIQESAPERLDLKIKLLQRIDEAADVSVLIASSTSGLLPTQLQSKCKSPMRVLVGHPFNPVYLLPLVEVVGGAGTAESAIGRASQIYTDLGMHPLRVRKEVPGFIADRLQEALWREALHLVNDGLATPEELDKAIFLGPGLRWAFWGTCLIFHLAGGAGGMRQMLEHFNPELFPWSHLEPPLISDSLVSAMATGCDQYAQGKTLRELEAIRDKTLVAVLKTLREQDIGAGRIINEFGRG